MNKILCLKRRCGIHLLYIILFSRIMVSTHVVPVHSSNGTNSFTVDCQCGS